MPESHRSGPEDPQEILRSMHTAPYAIVVNRGGVILAVNDAFAELYALSSAADAIGRSPLEFVAPEVRARVAGMIADPPNAALEYDCLRADGQPITVRGQAHAVELDGAPSCMTVVTIVDSEGATADRLHQASEFFRLAFEFAPIGKALVSPEGRILAANAALTALVGVPESDLLGRPYNVLIHPDDERVGSAGARALRDGTASGFRVEVRYVHALGHEIRVEVTVSLVRTRDGQPLYFVAQLEDVTQQREAEAALRLETERLKLLRTVAEAANAADDASTAYARALAAVCAHAGWPLGHVYHRSRDLHHLVPSDLWHFAPDAHDRFDAFRRATAGTAPTSGLGLAGRVLATGAATWLRCDELTTSRRRAALEAGLRGGLALPVSARGDVVAVLEFFTENDDVPGEALMELLGAVGTQLGRAAEREVARTHAAELDEARARFVANAAHELRTPLASLRTVAGLLGSRRAQMTDDEIAECCELLERQGSNLDTLVADLLDLSRVQQGHDDFDAELVDVEHWMARALETALPPDCVAVSVHVEPGLVVFGPRDRLHRALVNLLTNAYRHGGPTVEARAWRDGADVVVAVEDDGDGVPRELEADLFEPFTRHGAGSGAGLGLAITRALVEQAGGSVAYEGTAGRGARFVLRLELAQ